MSEGTTCMALLPGTISDLIDGALTPFVSWRICRHIGHCASCAAELAAERRLQSAARAFHADAVPSVALREKALASLPVASLPAPRRVFALSVAALVCLTATGGAVGLLTLSARPLPAFAQVERAMEEIKTVQYWERYSIYDVREKKTNRFDLRVAVRFDIPAQRWEYPEGLYAIDAPEGELRVWRSATPPHDLRYRVEKPRPFDAYPNPGESADPAVRFRQKLQNRIMPPEGKINEKNPRGAHWESREEIVGGRRLIRFEISLGSRPALWTERLTRPAARSVLWADPETLRVLRTLDEYYDGEHHSRIFREEFRYNEPLSDSLFSLTPPKNAQRMK